MLADSATMAVDSVPSDSTKPPSKRVKTSDGSRELSRKPSSGSVCAICFADDGRASRGEIECCDHYYCFICIMEWSKTESRCPVCRRRFTTVRRPPKPGVFPRHRLISVPVRDQACNTSGSVDPYAEIVCNVCHSAEDDCLLLLCDLCDSASHTYCVGLGATVPERDWFCHDCSVSRAECVDGETDTGEDTTRVLSGSVAGKTALRVLGVSSHSHRFSFCVVPDQDDNVVGEVNPRGTRTFPSGWKKDSTDDGARTLDRCRSVHSRIRAMRENWNALRRGSMSFSSSSLKSCRSSQKQERSAMSQRRLGKVESSSSTSYQQFQDQVGFGSYDVDRAWKMMDIAKSKQCTRGKTSLQSSNVTSNKASASKERANVSKSNTAKGERFIDTSLRGTEWQKYRSQELEKERRGKVITNEAAGSSSSVSKIVFEENSSVKDDTCQENRSILPEENANQASSKGHDGTKSEIQSLVKFNLKLLSRDNRLGFDAFKEIARRATHTVLAACGLEHRKRYAVRSFRNSACSHLQLSQQIPKSAVMPRSCQQCFNSFVKDVVSSIMFENVGFAKSSS